MGKIAVVFSGQGAQKIGMGKELYDNFAVARKVFDAAEKITSGITNMCFEADAGVLNRTINTQPCVYTVASAAAAVLKEIGFAVDAAAGFSLGETAALAFAGAFSFTDGLKLILKRAEFMDSCAAQFPGSMAAVLRLSDEKVIELCEQTGAYAVNFNCPQQVSVAGGKEQLLSLAALVAQNGGRFIPLAVSGAFHSPYMKDAGKKYLDVISGIEIKETLIPVYSNISAQIFKDIPSECARQFYNPVLWKRTVENLYALGFDTFIETGPGKVLSGMISKTCPDAKVFCAESLAGIEEIKGALNKL